jgi:NAD(P)-dependent dehydrogenase (short-subunit alcohol dehydrogenase family)
MNQSPVAIVTGAGSGIGRATALGLARQGYTLVLVGRTQAKLHETVSLIEELPEPVRTSIAAVDVTDSHAVDDLVAGAVESFGRINALVNVAGYASLTNVGDVTAEVWRKTVDTNLSALVYLTHAAWEHLARAEGAIVVNVSSMASKDPFPGLGVYAVAKVGVNMLTTVTAREGEEVGIGAVCIAPGAVETPMLRSMFDTSKLPAAAALSPDEVAELIVACITGERSFEPGETIFVQK